MGNDGGSIPKRRELVKESARLPTLSELKSTLLESLGHAWTHCALTDDVLDMDGAVADWRGRLFNYEAVLHALAPSSDSSDPSDDAAADRARRLADANITSLRDIVRLKFKQYAPPGAKPEAGIRACPVSLKELGPGTKAVYVVPCGHVFAEAAMREVADSACPECSEAFVASRDVVPILPREDAELERLRQRMTELKAAGLSHNLKKDKSGGKKKKRKAEDDDGKEVGEKDKNSAAREKSKKAHINNPMTASLTAKVMAEQEERNKRRKMAAAK